jgi:glycosyltransferase involved in cell wall biosynthesis
MADFRPLLSVVVTTHKRSFLLKRALSSLLSLDDSNYEIVLCADDNCKDTFQVAQNMLRDCDSFLRIPGIKGPAESRNIGAQIARGRWISFLDDDDAFVDGYISYLIAILKDKNLDREKVLYSSFKLIFENREDDKVVFLKSKHYDISKNNLKSLLVNNFIPMNSMVFSADIFARHSFDLSLQSHEDWDFLISLVDSEVDFEWFDSEEGSAIIYIDASKTTRNYSSNIALDFLSIYRKWPCSDQSIRQMRAKKLKKLGISRFGIKMDETFL